MWREESEWSVTTFGRNCFLIFFVGVKLKECILQSVLVVVNNASVAWSEWQEG